MATAKRFASQLDHRAQVARARRHLGRGGAAELASVARAAGASMFHLARLHRAITGETVGRARTRMRIEAAAAALLADLRRPVTAIALEVGYATPSSLNKAFRAALGMTPGAFRAAPARERAARLARLVPAREPPRYELAGPTIQRTPDFCVVCVREHGPYAAVSGPLAWAALELQLAAHPRAGTRMAASHDDPRRAPADGLRYDAAVVIGADEPTPPGLQRATWRGGAFAVFAMRGDYRYIEDAFRAIFAGWPRHGLTKRAGPCLERYPDDPALAPPDRLRCELWVPILDPESP